MESAVLNILWATVVLYAPAFMANMAPPVAARWALPFGTPIAARVFGSHKTYRGFLAGIIAGLLTAGALGWLGWGWYGAHAAWAIPAGAWVGGFAMVGDALKSAVKRKLGVTPGKPFPPWDQLDFILGATAPMAWFGMGDWVLFVTAIVITPLLHLLVNIVAYWTGYKEVWW